jgi:hypothetical protein
LGEGAYAQVLTDHHSLIRSGLAAHGGKEVNTQGDGFFAVFSSPTACVAAAAEMQQVLETHTWPAGEHVRVRMGVHTGTASRTTATGLVGLDVHRAARVAAVAYGGQVLLSETAAALVRDSLPPRAALRDLGVHRLSHCVMASWRQGLLSDLGYPKRPECFTRLPQFGSIFGALTLLGPMMLVNPGLESVVWSPDEHGSGEYGRTRLQRGRARTPGGALKISAACTSASLILSN